MLFKDQYTNVNKLQHTRDFIVYNNPFQFTNILTNILYTKKMYFQSPFPMNKSSFWDFCV